MRMTRRLAAVTGLTATVLAVAAPAEAHTSLTGATPAAGSTVPAPARIVLTYADAVSFPGVVVLDAHGGHHESGTARVAGDKVTEQVAGVLTPGVYTVGWRVVSDDGHPVTGKYRFTVAGGASPSGPASAARAAPSPTASAGPAARSGGPARTASSAGWLWVGGAAIVVAAAVGGVSLLRRRRAIR